MRALFLDPGDVAGGLVTVAVVVDISGRLGLRREHSSGFRGNEHLVIPRLLMSHLPAI